MATQKNFLTKEEKVALERIAKKSCMDCWFSIRSYGDGDFIYDLEENHPVCLEEGVRVLTEGIAYGAKHFGLTYNEVLTLNFLFGVLGLDFRFKEYDGEICFSFIEENEKLQRRIQREFEEYKRELLSKTPEEIINASYRTVWKGEIVQIVENTEYSPEQITGLSFKKENILDFLYEEWLNADGDSVSDLKAIIEDSANEQYEKYRENI